MSAGRKPIFIPLKTQFFEAFKTGAKTEEYRRYGGPWNERNCYPGRQVVLSKGYGKYERLKGRIVGTRFIFPPNMPEGWAECYGDQADKICFAIKIDLAYRAASVPPAATGTKEAIETLEAMAQSLRAIEAETVVVPNHTDPGALIDCWNNVRDDLEKLAAFFRVPAAQPNTGTPGEGAK